MERAKILMVENYPRALEIIEEYLPGHNIDTLSKMYKKYPSLFIGYYIEDALLGICFGYPFKEDRPDDDSVMLSGIAIVFPNNAQGRGTILLRAFEAEVKRLGYDTISVGSANGYAERFYIKNGYIPKSLMIRIKKSRYSENPETKKFRILNTRQYNDSISVYVETTDYSVVNPQYMLMLFNGYDYCFIMEKKL